MKYSQVCLLWLIFAATPSTSQCGESATVTSQIDDLVRIQWRDYDVAPSESASDGEWLRRVFLDLVGRVPTTAEYLKFVKERGHQKRADLIQSLLYDDAYNFELARNWATLFGNLLIGRGTGNERNSLVDRQGFQKYLRDAFASNRGYDQIVRELIVARGNNKPGLDGFNGAVNFLTMKLENGATQATADVSRLFLGKQVQCTQCHDHPFNDWKQNQFWELNSFFRQAVALRRFDDTDNMVSHVEMADQDFGGEGNTPKEAEVYYEVRDATLEAAYPVFIDGTELPNKSGLVRDVNRRQQLAKLIVSSEEMPRAIVNRIWAHFFNQGFTTPVDDMGPHNPPTHPELLDLLAGEFQRNSFDLRLLMKWIVSSEAYSLSSRITKRNAMDDPSKGERPLFSHYYLRQMRAEELFDSLIVATKAGSLEGRGSYDDKRRDWLKQFVVAFGNDEGTEGSTFDGTISQSLVLFNGDLVQNALSVRPGSWLYRLNASSGSFDDKVDRIYIATLCRNATKREKNAAKQMLQWRSGKESETLQDICWAVLNSNEFILNH